MTDPSASLPHTSHWRLAVVGAALGFVLGAAAGANGWFDLGAKLGWWRAANSCPAGSPIQMSLKATLEPDRSSESTKGPAPSPLAIGRPQRLQRDYDAKDLVVDSQSIDNVLSIWPEAATTAGSAIVRCRITSSGSFSDCSVKQVSSPGFARLCLAEAAVSRVRNLTDKTGRSVVGRWIVGPCNWTPTPDG